MTTTRTTTRRKNPDGSITTTTRTVRESAPKASRSDLDRFLTIVANVKRVLRALGM